MQTCPECGKRHKQGKALEKCRTESLFDLGHYRILGLTQDNPKVIKAKRRADVFDAYAKTI